MTEGDQQNLSIRTLVTAGWHEATAVWRPGIILAAILYAIQLGFLFLAGGLMRSLDGSSFMAAITLATILMMLIGLVGTVLFFRLFLVGADQFLKITRLTLFSYGLRMFGRYLQVIGLMILLYLPLVVGMTMVAAAGGQPSATAIVAGLASLVYAIVLLIFMIIASIRIVPTFLAISVGERVTFRDAWRGLKGRSWRIFCALLPYIVGLTVISLVIRGLMGGATYDLTTPGNLLGFFQKQVLFNLALSPLLYFCLGPMLGIFAAVYKSLWPAPDSQP